MAELDLEIQAQDKTKKATRSATRNLKRLGTDAERTGKKASGAFGKFGGATSKVTAGLGNVTGGLGKMTKGLGVATAGIGLAVGAITAMVGATISLVRQITKVGVELSRLATRTGHTVETLSSLQYAAQQTGLELDDFIDVSDELAIKASDAAAGNEELALMFKTLGINVNQFLSLNADQRLFLYAEAMSRVEDATLRTVIADELASDAGKRLNQAILQGTGGLQQYADEAARAGLIMSTETAQAAMEMNREMQALGNVFSSVGLKLYTLFIRPLIQGLTWLGKVLDNVIGLFVTLGNTMNRVVIPALKDVGKTSAVQFNKMRKNLTAMSRDACGVCTASEAVADCLGDIGFSAADMGDAVESAMGGIANCGDVVATSIAEAREGTEKELGLLEKSFAFFGNLPNWLAGIGVAIGKSIGNWILEVAPNQTCLLYTSDAADE